MALADTARQSQIWVFLRGVCLLNRKLRRSKPDQIRPGQTKTIQASREELLNSRQLETKIQL
jgi:hypothetical protein